MDLKALQTRLRDFAAARDWQPYHAPKNLAMALMVEAAELLELFQWKTITESRGFARNAADKERVADEIADVLLYLVQLADHTDVDIEQAVERKLRKNALKYPAKHPEPLLAAPAPVLPKLHLLVDWENVQPDGSALKALVPQGTHVWLFHGPNQKVDTSSHAQAYGAERVVQVLRSGAGKNALDFQLTYYVGYISARQPNATFVVVSNDQGYEPMLEHARALGFDARRHEYRKAQQPAVADAVKPKATVAAAKGKIPLKAVHPPATGLAPSAAQIAWRAIVRLRSLPADGWPSDLEAFIESLIHEAVLAKPGLADRAGQLVRDRPLGLARATDEVPSARTASAAHAVALPVFSNPAAKPVLLPIAVKAPAKPKQEATAKTAPVREKASRQDVKQLTQMLQGMEAGERPGGRDALLALLQAHLGEARVAHALAQLQAQKHVVLKGDQVSYPPVPAMPPPPPPPVAAKKRAAPAKKAALPATRAAAPAPPKSIPRPTAAQVAQAVLASLKKMSHNKPTRHAGLLKHIETHASKAADPKSMAEQVCALLAARKHVALSPDGQGVSYPNL